MDLGQALAGLHGLDDLLDRRHVGARASAFPRVRPSGSSSPR
jgi:hypothetical protein